MKKILITGADGFIGRHLLKKLGDHYAVTGIALKNQTIEGCPVLKLDLKNEKSLGAFFKSRKFDAIIHLAAMVPPSFEDPKAFESVRDNFLLTYNLLSEFNQSRAQKFIYASGISVIGQPGKKPVTEEDLAKPDNFYTLGKLFGEMLALASPKDKKIIVLRISAPYGPGQALHAVIPRFMELAKNSQPIEIYGTGGRAQDFIYINDVAESFEAVLNSNTSGIYNIASGQTVSMVGLAKTILAQFPESKSKIILGKKNDPQENYRLKVDVKKAQKELKFKARFNLEKGLKEYRKNA